MCGLPLPHTPSATPHLLPQGSWTPRRQTARATPSLLLPPPPPGAEDRLDWKRGGRNNHTFPDRFDAPPPLSVTSWRRCVSGGGGGGAEGGGRRGGWRTGCACACACVREDALAPPSAADTKKKKKRSLIKNKNERYSSNGVKWSSPDSRKSKKKIKERNKHHLKKTRPNSQHRNNKYCFYIREITNTFIRLTKPEQRYR